MQQAADFHDTLSQARQVLDPAILRWRYEPRGIDWLVPDVTTRRLGAITVSRVSGGPCIGWRDRELIAEDQPDLVGVTCTLSGREFCSGGGHQRIVETGDISFFGSQEELRFEVLDWSSKLVILAPRSRFRAVAEGEELPGNGYIDCGSPLGAIIGSLLAALADRISDLDDTAAECVVESALDLVARSIVLQRRGPIAPRTTLFRRITDYIDRNLREDLTPSGIADAHRISVRYLHLLFSREGLTVSSWIRERRLLRCRDELGAADCRVSLTQIAQRWRFCDSAHFSRQFKKRFGLSPKQWRGRSISAGH